MPVESKKSTRSCRDYAESFIQFDDAVRAGFTSNPLTHCLVCLMGSRVRIRLCNNTLYDGILAGFSGGYDLGLRVVHSVADAATDDDTVPTADECHERMIFPIDDIVSMQSVVDYEALKRNAFSSEKEGGRLNGAAGEKRLEVWESDATVTEELTLGDGHGWSAEEMFRKNEEEFGVTSNYDETLLQYNSVDVEVDKTGDEYKAKVVMAERMARLIEANPASRAALDLENDDEERDIVPRAAGGGGANEPNYNAAPSVTVYSRTNRSRTTASMDSRQGRGGPPRNAASSYNQRGVKGGQQRDFDSYQNRVSSSPRYQSPSTGAVGGAGQSLQTSRSFGGSSAVQRYGEDRRRGGGGGGGFGAQKQSSVAGRTEGQQQQQMGRRVQSYAGRGGYKDNTADLRKFGQDYRLADGGKGHSQSSAATHATAAPVRPMAPSQQRQTSVKQSPRVDPGAHSGCAAAESHQRHYASGGVAKDGSPPRGGRATLPKMVNEFKRSAKSVPLPQNAAADGSGGGGSELARNDTVSSSSGSQSAEKTASATERSTSSVSSIKSIQLNPEAEEFRPQHPPASILLQQQQVANVVHMQQQQQQQPMMRQIAGYYPVSMAPNISGAPPPQQTAVYPNPAASNFSVQIFPGNPPLYNVQSSQTPVAILQNSGNVSRQPRKATSGGGGGQTPQPAQQQSAAAQATMPMVPNAAQAMMAAQSPYFVQYTGPMSAGGQGAISSNSFLLSGARLLQPQYVVPQPGDTVPQSVYALPQFVQVAAPYGNAAPPIQQVIPNMSTHATTPVAYGGGGGVEATAGQNSGMSQPTNGGGGGGGGGGQQSVNQGVLPSGAYPMATAMANQQVVLLPGGAYLATAPAQMYGNAGTGVACTTAGGGNCASSAAPPPPPPPPSVGQAGHAGLIQMAAQPPTAVYATGHSPYATADTGFIQYASAGVQLAAAAAAGYHQNLLRSSSVPAQYGHAVQQQSGGNPPVATVPNN